MGKETINIINSESPLQRKNAWKRAKQGLLVLSAVVTISAGYLAITTADYNRKVEHIRDTYLNESYTEARTKLASLLEHRATAFPWVKAMAPTKVTEAIDYIKILEDPNIRDESKKKLQQNIEETIFSGTEEDILRMSTRTGSYSTTIDSLIRTPQATIYLQQLRLAQQRTNEQLGTADQGLLLKVLLEYENGESKPNDATTTDIYFERRAEQLLRTTITKEEAPDPFTIESLYFQAINALTERILLDENPGAAEGEVLRCKIEEISGITNNLEKYITVLQDVKSQQAD